MQWQRQDAITEGILITTQEYYKENNQILNLTSSYAKLTVANSGWFKDQEDSPIGTYCGSVANINVENYVRPFIAKAYVIITYCNGETVTIYSDTTTSRTVKYVAEQVIAHNYEGILTEDRNLIDKFAGII